MVHEIYKAYPPPSTPDQEEYLVQTVKNWSIEHALAVRPSSAIVSEEANPNHVLATNAPVTLFPSPFSKSCFDQARSLQPVYNELYAAIASDEQWLEQIMKECVVLLLCACQCGRVHAGGVFLAIRSTQPPCGFDHFCLRRNTPY